MCQPGRIAGFAEAGDLVRKQQICAEIWAAGRTRTEHQFRRPAERIEVSVLKVPEECR
jgi:hypothetical protein